ncbi:sigma-70 family RNA polymerase sigma factor [Actinoplanes sp. KI2]|uniref:sigma-70 family RNA polymerase sigma factor n=1 Tax=Actinoplanes sp. KI2 TaxID=2983315 RepID=UPI0021D5EDED|nr:sigma-70 family RNA polymerase sigma factor [Actinoplanes sp. KI2]MCU7728796.1 sigma-70 family RNA polymerase sigma factor [Actinoplanes sp. KI2]
MDDVVLAERFEANRPRLRAVALRMLGNTAEADDAVQEAWLRLSRTGGDDVANLSAWLTTVVGRVCLDMLRTRTARREDECPAEPPATEVTPEEQAMLADSVGLALLVVLDTLTPAERLAFVLHDLFAVSFEEIAPVVGRSPDATRQLASRARRRVRTTPNVGTPADRRLVDAFIEASRGGDLGTLLTLLDPDVEIRIGPVSQQRGAGVVARFFNGRAQGARPALLDGVLGIAVVEHGKVKVALRVTTDGGRITVFEAITDPSQVAALDVELLKH